MLEMGSVMAGQVSAMVNKIQPAAEILEEIMSEAHEVMGGLCRLAGVR